MERLAQNWKKITNIETTKNWSIDAVNIVVDTNNMNSNSVDASAMNMNNNNIVDISNYTFPPIDQVNICSS